MSIDELGGQSRRDFIRKAAITGAFVVPAVTSFGMKVSGASNRSGSMGVGASNVGGSNLDPGAGGGSNLDPGAGGSNVTTTTTIASNVTTTTVASNVTTTTVPATTTTVAEEEVTSEETEEDTVLAAQTLPESK